MTAASVRVEARATDMEARAASADIAAALCAAFEPLRSRAAALDGSPRAAVCLAVALEDAANRLLDLSDSLNGDHLAAYVATLPPDLPDDSEHDAVA